MLLVYFYRYTHEILFWLAAVCPILIFFRHKISPKRFLSAFLVFYVLALLNVYFRDCEYNAHYEFLTGGNEFFKHTPESLAAMEKVIADTGRRLAPFTKIPVGLLYCGFSALMFTLIRRVKAWFQSRKAV